MRYKKRFIIGCAVFMGMLSIHSGSQVNAYTSHNYIKMNNVLVPNFHLQELDTHLSNNLDNWAPHYYEIETNYLKNPSNYPFKIKIKSDPQNINWGGFYWFYGFYGVQLEFGKTYRWEADLKANRDIDKIQIGVEQGGLLQNQTITTNSKKFSKTFVAKDENATAWSCFSSFHIGDEITIDGLKIYEVKEK